VLLFTALSAGGGALASYELVKDSWDGPKTVLVALGTLVGLSLLAIQIFSRMRPDNFWHLYLVLPIIGGIILLLSVGMFGIDIAASAACFFMFGITLWEAPPQQSGDPGGSGESGDRRDGNMDEGTSDSGGGNWGGFD
jgi:hypothetical protein